MNFPEVSYFLLANWSDPCEQVVTNSILGTSDRTGRLQLDLNSGKANELTVI